VFEQAIDRRSVNAQELSDLADGENCVHFVHLKLFTSLNRLPAA
jgi:hypothetical protein